MGKSAPNKVGKRQPAKGGKANYLALPWSESDCSYQLREKTSLVFLLPPDKLVGIRGQLSMEVSLSRLLAFPFTASSYMGSHLASSSRERVSGDTTRFSGCGGGEGASYLL